MQLDILLPIGAKHTYLETVNGANDISAEPDIKSPTTPFHCIAEKQLNLDLGTNTHLWLTLGICLLCYRLSMRYLLRFSLEYFIFTIDSIFY